MAHLDGVRVVDAAHQQAKGLRNPVTSAHPTSNGRGAMQVLRSEEARGEPWPRSGMAHGDASGMETAAGCGRR